MDKEADDIFTEFLGTTVTGNDSSAEDWVDSLYESINNSKKDPSEHHIQQQQQQQDLYNEVSELKTKQLQQDDDNQSNGSFTIPVDSPSMHIFVHSDDELDHPIDSIPVVESITSSNTSLNTKPPTFAQVQSQQQQQQQQQKSSLIPIHPKPDLDSKSRSLPASPLSDRLLIYKLIKEGLKDYCESLYNAAPDKSHDNRAEYMSKYLQSHNVNFSAKNVSECFSQIRKDETDFNITKQLNDGSILVEIRGLLIESVKRRKSYTKRKGAKSSKLNSNLNKNNLNSMGLNKPSLSSTTTTLSPVDILANNNVNGGGGVVSCIKIGAFLNQRNLTVDDLNIQSLSAIADYSNIIQNREDERYIYQLRSQSSALKNCIDDIYGNSLPVITYPLTYSKVPLNISPTMSIDLENDRMISYVDVLLDLSDMIYPSDKSIYSQGNYTKIIQLKSITRIYDHGTLIYRKCDPVTGFFPSDVSNVSKIILPLQAKFWAGFINDHHNGIVNQSVFEKLKITHTLLPNDDIIKFKTGSAPIYSFIWEFNVSKPDQNLLPYSVIISKLDKQKTLSTNSAYQQYIPSPQPGNPNQHHPHHQHHQHQHDPPVASRHQSQHQSHSFQFQKQPPRRIISMGAPTTLSSSGNAQSLNSEISSGMGIYKNSNHSMSTLPIHRSMRNSSSVGHKRTRSRSVNEIDFLSDINTAVNSTLINDPFTPVSPSMIMNNANGGGGSSFKQPMLDNNSFLQSDFDPFSTPQSTSFTQLSSAPASQTSFDLNTTANNASSTGGAHHHSGNNPQLGRFRNVSMPNPQNIFK